MAKVVLKNVRGAFLNLWEPKKFGETGEARCNGSFLMDPSTPHGKSNIAAMQKAIIEVANEKWREKSKAVIQALKAKGDMCLQDGAAKSEYDGFEGMMFVSAGNKSRPVVVDKDKSPLTEADGKVYSGCFLNVSIDVWAQDNKYGKRVNAKLLAVQFHADGAAFSGGAGYDDSDFEGEEATETAGAAAGGDDDFFS